MKYISIIDMGINNIRSVVGILNYFGFKTIITKNENKIMDSSALILPGVGSFPEGIKNLKKNNTDKIIKNFFSQGKPILAICLGFQMIFSSSEEFGNTKGLNILNGRVRSLKSLKMKKIIPNLGWNLVTHKINRNNHLFKKINSDLSLYFIHSYYAEPKNKNLLLQVLILVVKKLQRLYNLKSLWSSISSRKKWKKWYTNY